jgi:general secretion pathway protein N
MKVKIVILIAFVYCITLLVKLPAAVVVEWMPKSAIKINNVTGTIWQGQAKEIVINPKVHFENVTWNLQPLSLLSLKLEADVAFNNGVEAMSGKGNVYYGLSGAGASNVILDITSKELLSLVPMRLPVSIEGEFNAAIKEITEGEPYCEQLIGNILWQNAVVGSQLGDVNLASPSVDLGCDDGNLTAFVTQESDELTTTLDIRLSEGGVYQLNGEIQGTNQLAPDIANSLTWIGPKNENGATILTFSGQL